MGSVKQVRRAFWSRLEATERLAELHGSAFTEDSPELRVERMAQAVVDPEYFNQTYLGHYFREAPPAFHSLIYLALLVERWVAIRAPRGHAKTTVADFAYTLHQVVCGPILRELQDGTLAASNPALHDAIARHRRQVWARLVETPWTVERLGLPHHWDAQADIDLDEWLAATQASLRAAGELPIFWDPYIQLISEVEDLAIEITGTMRLELELNPLLRSDWGDLTPCKAGDWRRPVRRAASDADWECNGVRVGAFGMRGSIRGGKHGEWRPTLCLVDDPDGEESTQTRKQRDRNMRKLASAARHGLEPRRARMMVLSTPSDKDCVVCRLTEHEQYRSRWARLRFVAVDERGVLLFPGKWTLEELAEEEAENPDGYGSELRDRPPNDSANPFGPTQSYDRADFEDAALPVLMWHDPSYGQTSGSDFQATVTLRGPTPEGWLLVHRYEQTRIGDPLAHVAHVNDQYAQEHPDLAAIEAIALGLLIEALATSQGNAAGIFPSWIRITHHKDSKHVRIRGIAPWWNAGVIRFPSDKSCRALEHQGRDYGESGATMAGLDALAGVAQLAMRHARGGTGPQRIIHSPRRSHLAFAGGHY